MNEYTPLYEVGLLLSLLVVAVFLFLGGVIVSWYRAYGRSALYTKNNTPVMVDQIAEQRRLRLRQEQQIHRAVSPHAEHLRRAAQPHIERELQRRRNGQEGAS